MSDAFTLKDLTDNSYDLSCNGSLYIGTVKLGGFKSCTLSFSADTVDNATRDDQGWAKQAPGNRSGSLEVTCNKMETDPCQVGLRAYIISGEYQEKGVEIVYRSEDESTAPGTGFKGTFVLTNYSETQGMDGTAVECSMTFAAYGEIVSDTTVSGSGGSGGTGT